MLVTGAANRIGRAIAQRFGAGGWHVVIHHRHHPEEAAALAASLPSAEVVSFELADRAGMARVMADLAARLPDWRAIACNACAFRPDWPDAPDRAVWDEVMAANLAGNVELARLYLAQARSPTGRRVLNLLDQKLANLNPDFFSYTVGKAGHAAAGAMLAQTVAAPDRVVALSPGNILPSHDQTTDEFALSSRLNLLGRTTTVEDIADAAWLLVTGPVANGTHLFVDGGQHLVPQRRDVLYLVREEEN
ncbi:MAG: SDR family oxidoreductase [Proteobacteria bacterium]|nr:SDR family oxidoreductase [Pseudomonadota bacterium]